MYFGLSQPLFYVASLWFSLAVVTSWVIPGIVILRYAKLKQPITLLLSALPLGMALWGLQGYVLGYAGLRWLSYGYLGFWIILFFRQWEAYYTHVLQPTLAVVKRQPLWLWLMIISSIGLQLYAHVASGLRDAVGIKIYFVNAVDGVMHLGYIESLKNTFPPMEPGAVGYPLVNYHYWSDLILAELSRVWGLPSMHLFFQWVPILLTGWTLLLICQVIRTLGGNRVTIAIALFLTALGGDAAYLFTQVLHGHWGESVSSLDSGVTFIFNFPQMVARTVFLSAFLLLWDWWHTKKVIIGILAGVLIATLFGFKIYYGLYAVTGLGSLLVGEALITFFTTLRKHSLATGVWKTLIQQWCSVMVVGVIGLLALSIYLPVNKGAGGLFYSPLEWPRLLLSADNIDFRDWALRMQVYEAYGNTRNLIIFNAIAVVMTFVAVYGTRMLGFLPWSFSFSTSQRKIWFFFVPANLIFLLLGLFTLQTSGGLNVFNFLIVPILSFNIFSAFTLSRLPVKILLPILLGFMALSLPRSVFQLKHFYLRYAEHSPDLALNNDQLAAFEYIKTMTPNDSVVQAPPSNSHDLLTPYVAYFGHRPSYLAGISMLESHNQPTKERQKQLQSAFGLSTFSDKRDALRALGIKYLYFSPKEYQVSGFTQEDIVYQNPSAVIVQLP